MKVKSDHRSKLSYLILNKLTLLLMCGFVAQLVEHRTVISEATGWNPVKALIFSRLSIALIGKFAAMITLHFHL